MNLDFKDEQLCGALNHVISGLLPHDNYTPETFGLLYPTLTSVLNVQDVHGPYYIFYTIFDKYYALQNAVNESNFQVRITRERFEKALANNLPDLILEPALDVGTMMNEEGKSGDITIPTIQQEAMGVVFSKTLDLYDECFGYNQTYEDAMAYIIDLKDSIKANVIETGMQLQRAIMSVGYRYGRKFYRGTKGWLDFVQQLAREVSELDVSTDTALVCDNLEVLPKVETQSTEILEALGPYGIPQLDDRTPMLRHRFAVFVARENTGKTKVITHLIATLIREGVKPYYACGESNTDIIFLQVVSSYIFQEYGQYFEMHELTGPDLEELSEDDRQIVQTAKARVSLSGLIIDNNLEYDNVYATFTNAYHKGCEAFFVDHTLSLRGRKARKLTDLVTNLALDCREFKNQYPVYIGLASQASTNLKDMLQKDKTTDMHQSPTAQSSTLSYEADEVFILTETDYLRKQNLLQWITFKRRGAPVIPAFYIKKLFHVSSYIYDPNVQGGEGMDGEELEQLIKDIGSDTDAGEDAPFADDMQINFD